MNVERSFPIEPSLNVQRSVNIEQHNPKPDNESRVKALSYLKTHPNAGPSEVSNACKISKGSAYNYIGEFKNKKG